MYVESMRMLEYGNCHNCLISVIVVDLFLVAHCYPLAVYNIHIIDKQQASKSKGYVLSSSTGQQPAATPAAATSSATPSSREEEMRKVRLRQQEIANQRALVAEKLRKEKEAAEKARKNQVILQKHLDGGRRMDGVGEDGKKKDDGDDNKKGGYNPLQPWSAGSSGFR